jgi:hypothetical protein
MKRAIAIVTLCGLPLVASAGELEQRRAESMQVVKEFMTNLKGELQKAMKAGGPVNAIDVCNKVAPAIAAAESKKHGWDVGRTSLKTRNPANAPDAWEEEVLQKFEERKAAGENPKTMFYEEVVKEDGKQYYRFMKAIPTGKVCLKCHGENIAEPVKAKLDALYPQDQARGFKLGDIRGAFTIKQPM